LPNDLPIQALADTIAINLREALGEPDLPPAAAAARRRADVAANRLLSSRLRSRTTKHDNLSGNRTVIG
jgi:hypothetical protein